MIWDNAPKFVPVATKPAKKITPEDLAKTGTEDGHQAALFCWSALPETLEKYPQLRWLFAIPNGGDRHIVEAIKFVATGLRKGVPDVFLPWPKLNFEGYPVYSGCFIEMKIEKRRKQKDEGLSKEQLEWIPQLQTAGYYVAVCYSWIEARDVLIAYLERKL